MKKINFLFFLVITLLTSCDKQFIDTEQKRIITRTSDSGAIHNNFCSEIMEIDTSFNSKTEVDLFLKQFAQSNCQGVSNTDFNSYYADLQYVSENSSNMLNYIEANKPREYNNIISAFVIQIYDIDSVQTAINIANVYENTVLNSSLTQSYKEELFTFFSIL